MQAHLRAHPGKGSGEEMRGPIQDFSVPKGCSTVWRRIRIISGA